MSSSATAEDDRLGPEPTGARLGAEFLGTFWLVLAGCGSAVLAAIHLTGDDGFQLGIGLLGVSLAFGLAVLTAAVTLGHLSGGHFNPAVTIGLAVARRFAWRDVPHYVAAQVVGATAGAAVLLAIASGKAGFDPGAGFASNGYGDRSPGGYGLLACLIAEVVFTAIFVFVVLGGTDERTPGSVGPVAIGLALTLIHLVTIPVTNTSVNPARSLGVAWFAGAPALAQVWLFIVAPLLGAVLAGVTYTALAGGPTEPADDPA